MRFRTKFLILLLFVTLLPLGMSFLLQRASMLHFGNKLTDDTRTLLNNDAQSLLHSLVNDYGLILKRDKAIALLTLQSQAEAVASRLSAPPPKTPQPIFYSADYASAHKRPIDLTSTSKYQRLSATGELVPIPISYSQQVIFLAGKNQGSELTDDLNRISRMTDVYKALHAIQPDLFLWQYTSLESGIHSSYPGKGGYPADYDPRQRQWYQEAAKKRGQTQQIVTDLTTGTLILTMAQPIYTPAGKLAGVTALDIDYRQFFSDWKIPEQWGSEAQSMVLVYHEDAADPNKKLQILLRNRNENHSLNWRVPVKPEYLEITDPQLKELQQDWIAGNSAVRKVTYQGREALWAYGPRNKEEPFPLVIVPYQQIISQAVNAEQFAKQQISQSLTISAALTIVVVAIAVLLAISRSRKVTLPILELATAANQLSAGNFDARVQIRTGDELEELGNTFNSMGARLKERDKMMQSLALAKKIQQQLLPDSAPDCPYFDLAGRSIYCDGTGGDYFDFIALQISGQQQFGLAVGDVSGHGIGPALVMATTRAALHSLVNRYKIQLVALANELNNQLCRDTAEAYFMTLFYGVLDPAAQSLRWISAGHAPLFLYRADGPIEELSSSGIPLGIIEDTPYEMATTIQFMPGDILLIGTDGIWEAQNSEEEMFGTQRVHELLIRHAEDSADTIAEKFIAALNRFRGGHSQDDDITLMVVKAR
ncbi:sigma-B regulation protein RsbU (phosphoserine phosphatase) [Desulfuromusa kysingii]|uniref:Sigma-B regulation protein RsbU (Phosphoserine phosphatase) n=1 Tax=Desulfuromusa kysingii TaxID=37625 RepID=A0A1H3ZLL7_9BACT|nr:SpoIIE family protein phosphatase [Desulfuromusa kysingii]SEA24570.1 sigma-B regulation protein RsbU (phosphoserine phosphatase) [Desulfuromusa kysingii]